MILKEKKQKVNMLSIMYMITIFLNLLLIEPAFKIEALGRVRYIISLAFICVTIIIFISKKKLTIKKESLYYFLSNIIPYCIIFLIMIIKCITLNFDISSQIIVFLYWLIPICLMQCATYLFEDKAIDYTFFAMMLNYFFCILAYLSLYGIDGIIHFFYYVEKGVSPLEIHELTFSVGLIFIYYAFFEKKTEKYHKFKINLCILCLFFGFKRIEILAIVVVYLLHIVLNIFSIKNRKLLMNIISIAFIIVSFVYLIIVRSGFLEEFSKKYEINFNSRLEAYNYFKDDYEISPLYKGKGLGYVMNKLETADSSLHGIGDLHNDILKLYIELGFLIWLCYFINYTFGQTNRLKKRYNAEVEELYFLLMVFTFVLYLTDNVNRYLIYLLVFTMLPYTHYLKMRDTKN